MQVITDPELDY